MSHSPSPRPVNADPVDASVYRLTVDHLGVCRNSTHTDNDHAYRALITFAITTDFYLLAQRCGIGQQRYTLLDISEPHQQNPRVVGHAVIEQQLWATEKASYQSG